MNIKTDANGNITSISESDSRRSIDLRRTIDLDTSAQYRPLRQSAQGMEESSSKMWFFRTEDSYPENYHNELLSNYNNVNEDSERDSLSNDKDSIPCASHVKKIDIKLPC